MLKKVKENNKNESKCFELQRIQKRLQNEWFGLKGSFFSALTPVWIWEIPYSFKESLTLPKVAFGKSTAD